jgi:hypothetical protein
MQIDWPSFLFGGVSVGFVLMGILLTIFVRMGIGGIKKGG